MVNTSSKAALILGISAMLLAAVPLYAQHAGHGTHGSPAPAGAAVVNDATKAFAEANAKMHNDMTVPFTGDADVDFVQGMIPHHQGAIDMARIVLRYGKDPEVRKLAEDILRAQDTEIAFMRAWLAKRTK